VISFALLAGAPLLAAEVGSFDRTLNVTGPVDLTVETNSGGITVRSGSGNSVFVHATISANNPADTDAAQRAREVESNPPIRQSGNTIRIEHLDNSRGRNLSITYEITTPAQTKLSASAGSGAVHISGLEDSVRAQTGSGAIDVDTIRGNVQAQTGSGGIQASNVTGSISGRTGSGGITVRLPASGGFDVRAKTGSGRINVDPPMTVQSSLLSDHEMEGKVRGGGPLLDLMTGSGGVRIE
jgi:hypothetical protein